MLRWNPSLVSSRRSGAFLSPDRSGLVGVRAEAANSVTADAVRSDADDGPMIHRGMDPRVPAATVDFSPAGEGR